MAAQTRSPKRRQAIRRALLMASFLAFPVTLYYFSPYLIIEGGAQGIVTGSAIVFAALFLGSLVFGRVWCGWACPAAGLQEPLAAANNRRVGRRAGIAKWFIWVPWIAIVIFAVMSAGGYHTVDPLFGTVGGISVAGTADRPILFAYVIYFAVVVTFFTLALAVGRRGGCHTVCWMAPFMIIGRWVRNHLGAWPALRLKADASACTSCGRCTTVCPMSIDVAAHAAAGALEDSACALCGECVDACPRDAIRYSFSSGK